LRKESGKHILKEWSFTDPAGNTMEGKGEMKRVKKMTSK